ncbi:MAG: oligosaccharide flippase family protein [Flavobacteriales bacterium]|nr:oligosaccharide flippase family protein [Flavobacteriales bacterium]
MNKLIVKGIVLSVLLNLAVKSLWILGVELGVQRVVGNTSYGIYYSLYNVTVLFLIILDLGITNFNNRNIAQHNQLLSKHLGGLIILKLLLGAIYLLALLPVAFILNLEKGAIHILFLLGFAQIFNSFTLYLRSNLNALLKFGWDALLSVSDRLLLIIFCGIVLMDLTRFKMDVLLFARLQLISSLITMLIATLANIKIIGLVKLSFNWKFYYSILRQSLPFATLVLIMSVYTKSDAVLLNYLRFDSTEAGIYAAAYRLFDAFAQFAVIATGVLFPYFSKSIKSGESVNEIFGWAVRLLFSSAFFLSIFTVFFSDELSDLLYKEHISETAQVLAVLMCVAIPYVLSIIAGSYITAAGRIRFLVKIALICALINVLLNIIFIPMYGALASAYIAILTQSISALLLMFFVNKRLKFNLIKTWVFRFFGFIFLLVVGAYFVSIQHWLIIVDMIIMIGLFIILLLIFRILNLRTLISFWPIGN